jgi:hypothetical protein
MVYTLSANFEIFQDRLKVDCHFSSYASHGGTGASPRPCWLGLMRSVVSSRTPGPSPPYPVALHQRVESIGVVDV